MKKIILFFQLAFFVLFSIGVNFAVAGEVLYGTDGADGSPSRLMVLDPSTGEVLDTIGAIGYSVTTLAADPITGTLYGLTYIIDDGVYLISINTSTGVGTVIGPTQINIFGMVFDSTGMLYGYGYDGSGEYLCTINTATGEATPVSANTGPGGSGLVFGNDGSLYLSNGDSSEFYRMDPATGTGTLVTMLDGTGNWILDLSLGSSGTIYGITNGWPTDSQLITIDPTSGHVTHIADITSGGVAVNGMAGLAFGPAPAPKPQALYGANGAGGNPAVLMLINKASGEVQKMIGPIGYSVGAMAVNPVTGTLYGVTTGDDPAYPRYLITIDTYTGVGTLVGPTNETIIGISFDTAGTLYGNNSTGPELYTINTSTGAATPVSVNHAPTDGGGGLVFTPDGSLYLCGNDVGNLYRMNPATGTGTVVSLLDGVGNSVWDLTSDSYGVIYSAIGGAFDPGRLITIDPASGHVTYVADITNDGQPVNKMSAVAFGPAPPAPPRVLYGTDGADGSPSRLMVLDPSTGEVLDTIGAIGYSVLVLAADPITGTLYGLTYIIDDGVYLISINTSTGVGTVIGPTQINIFGMVFDSAGMLYGYGYDVSGEYLCTIDTATGEATPVSTNTGPGGSGLVFGNDGSLYLSNGDSSEFYRMDLATGTGTLVTMLDGTGNWILDLSLGNSGTIYGITNGWPTDSQLITIDPTSGHVTHIADITSGGVTVNGMAGLAFGPAPAPKPQVLYGANGAGGNPAVLMLINKASGEVQKAIGPIGYSVGSMAANPVTGILYGVTTNFDPAYPGYLITIDTYTGAGTLVGPTNEAILGISFDAAGTLYGYNGTGPQLCTINTSTGSATPVSANLAPSAAGGGLSFTPDGTLYLCGNGAGNLYRLAPAAGTGTVVSLLDGSGNDVPDLTSDPYGTIYSAIGGASNAGGLITIDPASGHVTYVADILNGGQPVNKMSALAFGPAPPAPPRVLYGTDGADGSPSRLMVLDPSTGEVLDTIGAIGYSVLVLAADPITGTLYGLTYIIDDGVYLISINTSTGVGTVIGPTQINIFGMVFDSAGMLYGYGYDVSGEYLCTIDTATGEATPVSTNTGPGGSGLVFGNDGSLYLSNGDSSEFYRMDLATGTGTLVTMLDGTGNWILDLSLGNSGTIYGITNGWPTDSQLITIDPTSGHVTYIANITSDGQPVNYMTGLAFGPAPASSGTGTIDHTSISLDSTGGSDSVNVTAEPGYEWTAVSSDAWITIDSGASGTGNGTVNFTVAANATCNARTGSLTIAGQTFAVNQDAGTNPPQITGTPASHVHPGVPYSFTPTVSGGCGTLTYSIVNKPDWANFDTVTGALTGTGLEVGTYADISITVSDSNSESDALPVFDIEVTNSTLPQVSAGLDFTVGLKADGTVVALGWNNVGQCDLALWTGIIQISAGNNHAVGLKADGRVVAVGEGTAGQCDVSSWTGITQVSAGLNHTVGLKADGTVVAAGWNGFGQCDVSTWTEITQISAGYNFTVGLKNDGTVVAVGKNDYGQCNVSTWIGIAQISAGYKFTVGLKNDGTAVAIGDNSYGQRNVSSWMGIAQVSAGYYHTVGLKNDGTVVAVGDNSYGQRNVSSWTGITQVSAGYYHTVGLKNDGFVMTTGKNDLSQNNVFSWAEIQSAAAGGYHSVGLKANGTVIANGDNNYGQCNTSTWTGITQVSAGGLHTIGLKNDGTVMAVGKNDFGECNVSTWTSINQVDAGNQHTVGVKTDGSVIATGYCSYGMCDVSSWTEIIQVAAGQLHTVGLKKDGTVVAVGSNIYGQCDVSSWTEIIQVAAGSTHTVGLKTDGTVVAVGKNTDGQCDVSTWTDVIEVSAGSNHTLGLKADGTMVAVGNNSYGQCDVSSWTDVIEVSAGSNHTLGLKADGAVMAVGYNVYSQCNLFDWDLTPSASSLGSSSAGSSAEASAGNTLDVFCNSDWTAENYASWISITSGSSGTGDGSVEYAVEENTSCSPRIGILTIANKIFRVNQDAGICIFAISPESQSVPFSGGTGSVSVDASLDCCTWTAVSNSAWLSITSDASGTGSGMVDYSVTTNDTCSTRTGTLTIVGKTFTVRQDGQSCTYSINPTLQSFEGAGGSNTVSVTPAYSCCSWTAISNDSWIVINSGNSGTGNGTVNYTISKNNTCGLRTGTITIAGETFTISQASASIIPDEFKITASDSAAQDYFGCSVSISGDHAIVGAFGNDEWGQSSGSAYIFCNNGNGNWTQVQRLTTSDTSTGHYFGDAVSISGEAAFIGAYGNSSNDDIVGSAYVYEDDGNGNWIKNQRLLELDGSYDKWFGRSVSVDGDTAIIGAYQDDDNGLSSGSAYIYKKTGAGNWAKIQKLTASDAASEDYFGHSVDISEDTIAVGSSYNDDKGHNSGSVYIFKNDGNDNWVEIQKITASDGSADDLFGHAVSISGDSLIVSSHGDDSGAVDSGAVYIFKNDGNNWIEAQKLKASDVKSYAYFGLSVSISGTVAVVGNRYDNDNGSESGAAYIFNDLGNDNWVLVQKLTPIDGEASDRYGTSVSISDSAVIVGAPNNDDNGSDSGTAYIYPLPIAELNASSANIVEDTGNMTVTAGLNMTLEKDVIVPFTVTGTATGGGVDHDLADGTITIPAGELSGSATFNITDDGIDERDETVIVTMGDPVNAFKGATTVQTITIQDNDVTCSFMIDPISNSFGATGGTAFVSVHAMDSSCSWTATSNDTWISITTGASGVGNGTVEYSVAANAATSLRTGTITIAGETFTINQDSGIPENAKLYIYSDTTDGSTSFADESPVHRTVACNGDAHHDTFGKDTAIVYDGAGDYLSVANSDDWNFGSGNFTIDLWMNVGSAPDPAQYYGIFSTRKYLGDGYLMSIASGRIQWNSAGTRWMDTGVTPVPGQWYHLAVVRLDNTLTIYVNGVAKATRDCTDLLFDSSDEGFVLGKQYPAFNTQYFSGHMDEITVCKGTARWTGNFTPPNSPAAAAPGDTDSDGLLDDDEVNIYGTSPALLDTDGDGISDGEEVIYWVLLKGASGWVEDYDLDGEANNLLDADADGDGFNDGAEKTAGKNPSDPLSIPAPASAKLYIHSDTANGSTSFADESPVHRTVACNGDVHHDTFGKDTAIVYDGAGDYLSVANSDDWNFGSGNFTIDLWMNVGSAPDPAQYYGIFSTRKYLGDGYLMSIASGRIQWNSAGTRWMDTGVTPVPGQWYHLAVVRLDNTLTIYVNGVAKATRDCTDLLFDSSDEGFVLGKQYPAFNTQYFSGHMDEITVCKGTARWTGNFTPPNSPDSL